MRVKQAYEESHKGFTVEAWYLEDGNPDAEIVITRDGQPFREFLYPAYRIYNIAAHFTEMVDDFLDTRHGRESGEGRKA